MNSFISKLPSTLSWKAKKTVKNPLQRKFSYQGRNVWASLGIYWENRDSHCQRWTYLNIVTEDDCACCTCKWLGLTWQLYRASTMFHLTLRHNSIWIISNTKPKTVLHLHMWRKVRGSGNKMICCCFCTHLIVLSQLCPLCDWALPEKLQLRFWNTKGVWKHFPPPLIPWIWGNPPVLSPLLGTASPLIMHLL